MEITTIGLDLAKSVFQVHAVDADGKVIVRKALRRAQVLPFFKSTPPCLVGMEACGTSHHWARELRRLGHEVRLMPPAYVKPYVKRGKTDANDAEAICEAVTRPTMRFVAIKSEQQQAALALHRTRDLLVKQRTQLVNMIRGLLAEFGIEMARGVHHALDLAARVARGAAPDVPELAVRVITGLAGQIGDLQVRLTALEKELLAWHRSNELSQRLSTIPGVGHRARRVGHRCRPLPLRAAVCGLAWPDTAAELQRRQGANGADLADGRPISETSARRWHDLARATRTDEAGLGRSAHRGHAGAQTRSCSDSRRGQSHRRRRLVDHGPRGRLPRASERRRIAV